MPYFSGQASITASGRGDSLLQNQQQLQPKKILSLNRPTMTTKSFKQYQAMENSMIKNTIANYSNSSMPYIVENNLKHVSASHNEMDYHHNMTNPTPN